MFEELCMTKMTHHVLMDTKINKWMHRSIHLHPIFECFISLLYSLSWVFLDMYYICNIWLKAATGFSLHSLDRLSAIGCVHHGNHNWNVPFLTSIHSFRVFLHRTIQYISLIMCDVFQSHGQTMSKNINILL